VTENGANRYSREVLAKLNKTVTPAKAGGQNVLKRLDSCFRRNDGEGLLQEAGETRPFIQGSNSRSTATGKREKISYCRWIVIGAR